MKTEIKNREQEENNKKTVDLNTNIAVITSNANGLTIQLERETFTE